MITPLFWIDTACFALTAFFALSLLLAVLGTGIRRPLSLGFIMLMTAISLWASTSVILRVALWLEAGSEQFWMELSTFGFALIGPPLLTFSNMYTRPKRRWPYIQVVFASALTFLLAVPLFRHQLVSNVHLEPNGLVTWESSSLSYALAIPLASSALVVLVLLGIEVKEAQEPHVPVGLGILVVSGVVFSFLKLPIPTLSITMLISVATMGYAVLVRQLFNPLKEITENLEELQAFNENIIQTMEGGIVLEDKTGHITFVNPKMTDLLGYAPDELKGQRWASFVASSQETDVNPEPDQGLKAIAGRYEMTLQTRDGQSVPVIVSARPLFEDGRFTGVLSVVTDITERKQAEEALRRSEARFRDLFEMNPDTVFLVSKNGVLEDVNSLTITGFGKEEVVGRHLQDLPFIAEDSRKTVLDHFEQRLQGEDVGPYTIKIRTKDGEIRYGEIDASLLVADGEIAGLLGIVHDVTERKRGQRRMQRLLAHAGRSQRLLLALGQAAQAVQRARTPDEVYRTIGNEVAKLGYNATIFTLTDDEAHLEVAHVSLDPELLEAAEELTGLSSHGFRFPLAQVDSILRIVTEGTATYVDQTTEAVAQILPEPARPLARRLVTLLGWRRSIMAPLTVAGQAHGLLAVSGNALSKTDLAAVAAFANQAAIAIENAQLYEVERATREQLQRLTGYLQAAREKERTRIAREIHDDLGQRLTALKLDLSWLTKRLPADQPCVAEKATALAERVDEAIQTVREVATELRPDLLDHLGLAAAIEWQTEEFARQTGMEYEINLDSEDMALGRGRATAIFRILQEALTNVVRHAEATRVRVELEVTSSEALLVVHDDGKGITERQVSDRRSMGLLGMEERARSWGGEVTFEGTPGQGTTVTVRIPRTRTGPGELLL
jgi:PAS domain S-box-containing protein